ncbi:MAG: CrcB family protein [Nitriliruptorales bacterium]|nr:CrcB family protein [Nitriliruptorales bacterium]
MRMVLVVLAGGLGGLARYGVVGLVQRSGRSDLPWGTAVVNLTGAAGLGALVGLDPGGMIVEVVGAGFLGGFTTFSTWMVESVGLAEGGSAPQPPWVAITNLVGMAVVGVAVAALAHVMAG